MSCCHTSLVDVSSMGKDKAREEGRFEVAEEDPGAGILFWE